MPRSPGVATTWSENPTISEAARHPRITIAVPSYNQGAFIGETLQSLVGQRYPNLEVIIQDAGSTDGAIEIAREFVARYPDVFQLHVEKDRGHAHALNLAYARSTGEILGYLNTDDTLYPGCLHRVAREIDPARGRYIVFGRCLFTGEGSPYVGREHPAEYHGHFDLLAVWKRGYNAIPQPSTFWHRIVHETCGGFDEAHNHGLDYLQWCRFSKRFVFHRVDALWSTYRMHPVSVTANKTEEEWLDIMSGYSRMHWGQWWHPLRWRCELSYRLDQRKRRVAALVSQTLAPLLPSVARRRALSAAPDGAFTGRYPDRWIGPVYRSDIAVPPDARRLILTLEHHPQRRHRRVSPALWLNGTIVDRGCAEGGRLSLAADLAAHRGTSCTIEVRTPEFFVPRLVTGSPDNRALSVLLLEQRIE